MRDRVSETTAKRPVRAAMRRLRAMLDGLQEMAPSGVALLDLEFRYLWVNALFARMSGRSTGEHIGRRADEILPELAPEVLASLQQVVETGRGTSGIEVKGASRTAPGQECTWLVDCQAVCSKDEVVGIGVFVRDVTAQRLAEQELRRRLVFEKLLSTLSASFVSILPSQIDTQLGVALKQVAEFAGADRAGLLQFSADLRLLVMSHGYGTEGAGASSAISGCETLGWYCDSLRHGRMVCLNSVRDCPPEAADQAEWMQATGRKSHLAVPILVGGSPVCVVALDACGEERVWTSDAVAQMRLIGEIFANALKRRQAEEQAHRTHMELAHMSRVASVGHLATSIAHEINQPLCAVVSNAQAALRLISSVRPDFGEVVAALRDIVTDGKRAGEVIRRMHALLKRQDVKRVPVDINEVASTVLSLLQSHALIRRIGLSSELDKELPPVLGDQVQLQQVLLNLATNGMEAICDGPGEARELTIGTRRAGEFVVVSVQDTGVGLPAEVATRIFEPFFTTKPQGLGMGLAISRTIIEAHGGRMWATSNPGPGAMFQFSVPVAREGVA